MSPQDITLENGNNIEVEVPDQKRIVDELYPFRQEKLKRDIEHEFYFEISFDIWRDDPKSAFESVSQEAKISPKPDQPFSPVDQENPVEFFKFAFEEAKEYETELNAQPQNISEHLNYFRSAVEALEQKGVSSSVNLFLPTPISPEHRTVEEAIESFEEQGIYAKISPEPVLTDYGDIKFYDGYRYDAEENSFIAYCNPGEVYKREEEKCERRKNEIEEFLEDTDLLK